MSIQEMPERYNPYREEWPPPRAIHDPEFIRTLHLEITGRYIPRFELPLWSIEQRGASILINRYCCYPYPTAAGPANEWHQGTEIYIESRPKDLFSFRWTLSLHPTTNYSLERLMEIVRAFVFDVLHDDAFGID